MNYYIILPHKHNLMNNMNHVIVVDDASIRGNWSGQLKYHGKLVPLTLSRVYKGTPIL